MASSNECQLCYEPYDEDGKCPRLLPCGHTFCSCCLQKLLADGTIVCPTDRRDCVVGKGVTSLPKNFALLDVLQGKQGQSEAAKVTMCHVCDHEVHAAESHCLDCGQDMCQAMARAHARMQASSTHTIVLLTDFKRVPGRVPRSLLCPKHKDQYRYFDDDCKLVICRDCFALDHVSHKCIAFNVAVANVEPKVSKTCEEARRRAAKIEASEGRVSSVMQALEQNYREATMKLDQEFDKVIKSLSSRKEELARELRQNFQNKSANLSKHLEDGKTSQASLSRAAAELNGAAKSDRDLYFLLAYADMCKAMQTADSKAGQKSSRVDDVLDFVADTPKLIGMINKIGVVSE